MLEVLDVTTGHRQTLWASPQPFEAPNWTRDGALIVNTSGTDADWRGRLRRFDLATRQSSVIDTGERIRNNNDHVLSPDGKTLAISDQSLAGVGSTIHIAGPASILLSGGPTWANHQTSYRFYAALGLNF